MAILSEIEVKRFIELYPITPNKELAGIFNISESGVSNRANKLKLKKSYKNTAGHFKKGLIPHNKGKSIETYMKPENIESIKKTQFKKGNQPHNTLKVGDIITRNEDGIEYYWIKTENGLMPLHRHLWEVNKGKIPKGYNVIFIDKNPKNCIFKNLKLVSNKELMELNSMHQYPTEFKKLIIIKNKLKKATNEKN
jgi:hypothetical protein